jgi:hypothetical protein
MKAVIHYIKKSGLQIMLFVMLDVFIFSLFNSSITHADGVKNNDTPIILEITAAVGKIPDSHLLIEICKKQNIPQSAIYQWKNHLAIFGFLNKVKELQTQITQQYPRCTVKIYNSPYYNFNRKQRCGNGGLAKQWDNILLTANLVNNTQMQHEYLNYHATQFEKWPQVANGFCNAGFQQLLAYKNGRQLMLVISIPKGESLDKLNPKTSENNPKVDEWNKIMKKYQEGIPGTKPGEVWVFLKPIIK